MNFDDLGSVDVHHFRPFTVESQQLGSGSDGYVFSTLRMPDWVTVVAVSESGKVVLVSQPRVGIRATSLETPGGVIDSGEAPLVAAKRELLEETGYSGSDWRGLGWAHPNPALQGNRIHFFFLADGKRTAELNLDPHEEIEVELMPVNEVCARLQQGTITHALSALALMRAAADIRGTARSPSVG